MDCCTITTLIILLFVGSDEQVRSVDENTKAFLKEWESCSKAIKSLYLEFNETVDDPYWRTTTTRKGSARYLAPRMARLDLAAGNTGAFESIVLTPSGEFCHYKSPERVLHIAQWKEAGLEWALAVHPVSFFTVRFNMERLLRDFRIDKRSEKDGLVRLELVGLPLPRKQWWADSFCAKRVEVEVTREEHFIHRIAVDEWNGNRSVFEFTQFLVDPSIPESDFVPIMPSGWKIVRPPDR